MRRFPSAHHAHSWPTKEGDVIWRDGQRRVMTESSAATVFVYRPRDKSTVDLAYLSFEFVKFGGVPATREVTAAAPCFVRCLPMFGSDSGDSD